MNGTGVGCRRRELPLRASRNLLEKWPCVLFKSAFPASLLFSENVGTEHLSAARKAYSTDLIDEQWQLLEPLVPAAKTGGRNAQYERREIVNALFYFTKDGCTWRNLPHDLPPWSLVHYYFWHWKRDGTGSGTAPGKTCMTACASRCARNLDVTHTPPPPF